jgi:cytochrome c biogenesis protein
MTTSETQATPPEAVGAAKRFAVDNYAIADAPRLGWRGWLRWTWRQVTSMRLALILLLLLGLAAIPGSLLPQWPQDAGATRAFIAANPLWGELADTLGLLDVFGSAWFTAIYVLLFASLVGCIVPRTVAHGRAMRAAPSAAPTSLNRFEPATEKVAVDLETALERARSALRPRAGWTGAMSGYRLRQDQRGQTIALAGEKGHVREFGNLLFHLSLVAVLLAVAAGSLLTYRGQAVIIEGETFTNAVVDYDTYEAGRFFNPATLEPFTLRLDELDAKYYEDGRPAHFRANVTLTEPGSEATSAAIEVNRPLQVAGGKIYLQGNGFAPRFTVRDADGEVAFAGPVPFLPQDAVYTSTGVVKIPDVTSGPQIGLAGTLLPTAVDTPSGVPASAWPEPLDPVILFFVYTGDLGLDAGVPQNVYRLDMTGLKPVLGEDGSAAVVAIRPGETVELPERLGTVTWEDLPRFIAVDLRADPSLPWLLVAAIGAFAGIAVSLFGSRRRIWLHLAPSRGKAVGTLVTGAVLAPPHDSAAARELERVMAAIAGRVALDKTEPGSED